MLRELIDQSESVILINLDIHRNVMLRLSLQLEMGMFSAAIAGLVGVAFGMNLESSLEDVSSQLSQLSTSCCLKGVSVFWIVTGMITMFVFVSVSVSAFFFFFFFFFFFLC